MCLSVHKISLKDMDGRISIKFSGRVERGAGTSRLDFGGTLGSQSG